MSKVTNLIGRLNMGLLYHFFYYDLTSGVTGPKMRELHVLKLSTEDDVLLVLRPSELKKCQVGKVFPEYAKTKYSLSTTINPNELPIGKIAVQTYKRGKGESWLFRVKDNNDSTICIKMPASTAKRILQSEETEKECANTRELLSTFEDALDGVGNPKSYVTTREENKLVVPEEKKEDDLVYVEVVNDNVEQVEDITTQDPQQPQPKQFWLTKLLKWLFRV